MAIFDEAKERFLAGESWEEVDETLPASWKRTHGKRWGVRRFIVDAPTGPRIAFYEAEKGDGSTERIVALDMISSTMVEPIIQGEPPVTVFGPEAERIEEILYAMEGDEKLPYVAGSLLLETLVRSRYPSKNSIYRWVERIFSLEYASPARRRDFFSLSNDELRELILKRVIRKGRENVRIDPDEGEVLLGKIEVSYSRLYFLQGNIQFSSTKAGAVLQDFLGDGVKVFSLDVEEVMGRLIEVFRGWEFNSLLHPDDTEGHDSRVLGLACREFFQFRGAGRILQVASGVIPEISLDDDDDIPF